MVVSNIFIFAPTWGDDPIWVIFFKWVAQPPTWLSPFLIGFVEDGWFFVLLLRWMIDRVRWGKSSPMCFISFFFSTHPRLQNKSNFWLDAFYPAWFSFRPCQNGHPIFIRPKRRLPVKQLSKQPLLQASFGVVKRCPVWFFWLTPKKKYKVGPLPIINVVLTPINGLING